MTTDGKLTYCSATDENVGKGRCNHISHALKGESELDFLNRINKTMKLLEEGDKHKLLNTRYGYTSVEYRDLPELDFLREQYKNFDPEMFLSSENPLARLVAAENGYNLDKLYKDKFIDIRKTIARQGKYLDKLIKDKEDVVRARVAEQGYGLDKLVKDKAWNVRRAVARQGYGLDKLVDDEHSWVREAVAEQGYGLDKLINDRYYCVKGSGCQAKIWFR